MTEEEDFVHAVGECTLAWATIEYEVAQVFCLALRGDSDAAAAAFDAVIAFNGKLGLASAAVENSTFDPPIKKKWTKLHEKIKTAHSLRNRLAHGGYLLDDSFDPPKPVLVAYDSLSRIRMGESQKLNRSDVRNVYDALQNTREEIHAVVDLMERG